MDAALSRHHMLLNESITAHSGYVFQIIGDAFCAAFSTAVDGLRAALQAQRALAAEEWGQTGPIRVRMALHTGNAQVKVGEYTSGEYSSGLTLSRAARLLSSGHGGQILLSLPTAELVRDHLPDGATLRDMGARRLKDLIRPEHIYQVIAPDLPQDFPPLKTLDALPNNLPAQLTNFIGRETHLEQVRQLVSHNRLVTLTGPGGTGKTRLSLQVGAELIEAFEHGVWFVELASLTDGSLIHQRLASVLGIQEESGNSLADLVMRYVQDRQILVILDNCEHLLHSSAQLAVDLIRVAPRLQILVTSRERLHLHGEAVYPVPPLSIPDPHQATSLEVLSLSEAVRVFIDRAVTAQPAFQVTNRNAPAVAEICFRLDGLPLAIELAAARVRSLPVEKIAERISDRFRILTGGDRTVLPRHQTLRTLIDWSYELLSESEQAVLRRLSVFSNGWTLEAAEVVCSDSVVDMLEVIDLLGNLVEKSLVGLDPETGRYSMLETVRQYASEKLIDNVEAIACRWAHYKYYLQFAEKAELQLTGPEHTIWIERMEDEFDNLRAAIRWTLESDRGSEALHLCYAIGRLWIIEDMSEGRAWLKLALELRESASPQSQGEGLFRAGELAYRQGDQATANRYLNESLTIARALEYDYLIAIVLLRLAMVIDEQDPALTRQMLEESLAVFQRLGEREWVSRTLLTLGMRAANEGDDLQARKYWEQSLALSREAREIACMAGSLNNLGTLLYKQGDLAGAQARFEEALVINRDLRVKVDICNVLGNLGLIAIKRNDTERARALQVESLTIRRTYADLSVLAYNFSGCASVLRLERRMVDAARMQGFVKGLQERVGTEPGDEMEQDDFDETAECLVTNLGEEGYRQAFEAGKLLSIQQALELLTETT